MQYRSAVWFLGVVIFMTRPFKIDANAHQEIRSLLFPLGVL